MLSVVDAATLVDLDVLCFRTGCSQVLRRRVAIFKSLGDAVAGFYAVVRLFGAVLFGCRPSCPSVPPAAPLLDN